MSFSFFVRFLGITLLLFYQIDLSVCDREERNREKGRDDDDDDEVGLPTFTSLPKISRPKNVLVGVATGVLRCVCLCVVVYVRNRHPFV